MVRAPATRKAGAFDVVAEAVVGGATYARDMQAIAYPHIQTHRVYTPANATALSERKSVFMAVAS